VRIRRRTKVQNLVGKAKEAVGRVTGDKSTEHEGKAEQAKAKLKDAGEKVKDALKNMCRVTEVKRVRARAVRVTAQAVGVTAPGMRCEHGEEVRLRLRSAPLCVGTALGRVSASTAGARSFRWG
jgi:uncharacterized protein YjbJ (UPF0337 family)